MNRPAAMAAALAASFTAGATLPEASPAAAPPLAAVAAACDGAHQLPQPGGTRRTRAAVLCLVNRFRRAHGRRALRLNRQLTRAAQAYSAQMARRGFFAHTSPSGGTMVDRLRESGYLSTGGSWAVGENLAWGTHHLSAPAQIVNGWLRSPPHRANLLRAKYREAGIGVAHPAPARTTGATYTLEFGVRH